MMTRRNYVALAEALNYAKPSGTHSRSLSVAMVAWERCVQEIVDALQTDNSRFDRQRFYFAVGYGNGQKRN